MQQKGDLPTFLLEWCNFCLRRKTSPDLTLRTPELHTVLFPSDISYDRSPLQGKKKIHLEQIKKSSVTDESVHDCFYACLCFHSYEHESIIISVVILLDSCIVRLHSVRCDNLYICNATMKYLKYTVKLHMSATYFVIQLLMLCNNIALAVEPRHWTEPESTGCTLDSIFTHSNTIKKSETNNTPLNSLLIHPNSSQSDTRDKDLFSHMHLLLSLFVLLMSSCVRHKEGVGVCCVFMLLWFRQRGWNAYAFLYKEKQL